MNLQQLIELAILDAMGLLDHDEQNQFDAAFMAASPAVQAQVRREQTRLSVIEALLPDVAPPAGMRAAVLDAVRRQIQAGRLAEADGVAGEITPQMIPSRRVSPYWRAAALGMAAASIVLSVFAFQARSLINELTQNMTNDTLLTKLGKEFGSQHIHDFLFGPDTRHVVFKAAAQGFKGEAAVFYNPEWKLAKLFHDRFDPGDGRTYKLAIVDESGRVVRELQTFSSANGGLDGVEFTMDPTAAASKPKFAILRTNDAGTDEVLETGDWSAASL